MKCIHCETEFKLDEAPDLFDELAHQTNKNYKKQYQYQKRIQGELNLNIITCPECSHVIIYEKK